MLSFLSSISLWMGALLAVPLLIHFLGRRQAKRTPFPSLLLIKESFSRSMRRHRLKNLLLLLVRTLLMLCLLLALANPAWKMDGAGAAGALSGAQVLLLHNGVYGKLAGKPDRDGHPDALERQRRLLRVLDSASGKRTAVIPMLPESSRGNAALMRFGDYGEAAARLSASVGSDAAPWQCHIPVFSWADLLPARNVLMRTLKEHPGMRLVLSDYGNLAARVSAFSEVRARISQRAPTLTLKAQLHPAASRAGKIRVYLDGRLSQEVATDARGAEISLPLSEGRFTAGKLVLEPPQGFADPEYHFCFPNPGRSLLLHAGSSLVSLPSLGRENYFRKILHAGSAKDLPWAPAEGARETLRLVYLSDEGGTDASAYARAVEFVKRGGLLILGVGSRSDVPAVNRFLLQPLRMGRLGSLEETTAGSEAVEARPAGLQRLPGLPADFGPGPLGSVRKRFAFAPDSGCVPLLTQKGAVILAMKDFHKGKVLLWTTDLDDLDWTDLGAQPFTPLAHQAFQEAEAESGGGNRSVASDSIFTLDAVTPEALGESETKPGILDPHGRPFERVKGVSTRLRAGPFDELGVYRATLGGDSSMFAVNLASAAPREDWDAWNADNRRAFLEAFAAVKARVTVTSPEAAAGASGSDRPLWKTLFLAAILLLFLESLISIFFSLARTRL